MYIYIYVCGMSHLYRFVPVHVFVEYQLQLAFLHAIAVSVMMCFYVCRSLYGICSTYLIYLGILKYRDTGSYYGPRVSHIATLPLTSLLLLLAGTS